MSDGTGNGSSDMNVQPGAAQAQQGPPMLYSNIVGLRSDEHADIGIARTDAPFHYAAKAVAVPAVAHEFASASKHYPIVFMGAENPSPVVIFGVRREENLFVDANGHWQEDAYVPSYVRRYPFIMISNPDQTQFGLGVDMNPRLVGNAFDQKVFNGNELTEFGKRAVDFCQLFHNQHQWTKKFVDLLNKHNLLTEQQAAVQGQSPTERQVISSYHAVDAKRFEQLSDKALLDLRAENALGPIFYHLLSLSNWATLIRMVERRAATMPPAAND